MVKSFDSEVSSPNESSSESVQIKKRRPKIPKKKTSDRSAKLVTKRRSQRTMAKAKKIVKMEILSSLEEQKR